MWSRHRHLPISLLLPLFSLCPVPGLEYSWSEPIVTIQILFASDRSKYGRVIWSWLMKHKGKTAGVSGKNFSSLTKGEKKPKGTYIYSLPFLFYFGRCPKRTESLEVLQPFCNNEVEGQENYEETNPAPRHGRTAETAFESPASRLIAI